MISVVKKSSFQPSNCDFYIGRGSVLGNPYDFKRSHHPQVKYYVKSRFDAVEGFSNYLKEQIRLGDPQICDEINKIFMLHACGYSK